MTRFVSYAVIIAFSLALMAFGLMGIGKAFAGDLAKMQDQLLASSRSQYAD